MSEGDDSAIAALRAELLADRAARANEVHTLHGRIGGLEKKTETLATTVGELKVESADQNAKLDFLVKEAEDRAHAERVEREAGAAKSVALVKDEGEKSTFKRRLVTSLIALLTAVIGAIGGAAAIGH
jgi:hypothetical protein